MPTPADILRSRAAQLDAVGRGSPLGGRLVHCRATDGRAAAFGVPRSPVDPAVLAAFGADRLYRHQAEGIDAWRSGASVMLATGTGSGKSLVAQVAIADAARLDPVGTAIVLTPTKALAHDQLHALDAAAIPGVCAAAYDGDTDRALRAEIRRDATVLFTNPDMLHYGILPHHQRWVPLLARLSVIVVDELHAYRGVFGAHMAHVLRRLVRLARHYGASPRFVAMSATVEDPAALAEAMLGGAVHCVTDDTAPRPGRDLAIWNPPVLDIDSGTRASTTSEVVGIVADLVAAGHRTLAFVPSRRTAELVAEQVRRRVPTDLADRVACYRGGFLPEERAAVEAGLRAGALDAVIATSALELGIDVDGLDAVVLHGFPGTASSFSQQVGRVGRRADRALAVLVCGPDQLDQWIAAHPERLDTTAEPATIELSNPSVADAQLRCAAFELSFTHDDEALWPGVLDDVVRRLVADSSLLVRPAGAGTVGRPGRHRRTVSSSPIAVWHGAGWPVDAVGLRAASPGHVSIVDGDGRRVGSVDADRAAQVVHPGAVYLHAGRSWLVVDLDLDARRAVVAPHDAPTTTVPRVRSSLRLGTGDEIHSDPVSVLVGPAKVTTRVTSYLERSAGGDVLASHPLDLPDVHLHTEAVWFLFSDRLLAGVGHSSSARRSVVHAIEHALVGVAPLVAWCDRAELGASSSVRHPDTGVATVVIHDSQAGGTGAARRIAASAAVVIADALALLTGCGCADACPACLHQPRCHRGNADLDRAGAITVLEGLVAGRIGLAS